MQTPVSSGLQSRIDCTIDKRDSIESWFPLLVDVSECFNVTVTLTARPPLLLGLPPLPVLRPPPLPLRLPPLPSLVVRTPVEGCSGRITLFDNVRCRFWPIFLRSSTNKSEFFTLKLYLMLGLLRIGSMSLRNTPAFLAVTQKTSSVITCLARFCGRRSCLPQGKTCARLMCPCTSGWVFRCPHVSPACLLR